MRKPGRRPQTSRRKRTEEILAVLAEHGAASVDEMAARLGVTGMTIRRDLASLEAQGVVTRTHGGCVLRSPLVAYVHEKPFAEKSRQRLLQKSAIARAAVARIADGSSVYLDTGTTAIQVARHLRATSCTVFTNNLWAALELFGKSLVATVVFGGTFAGGSPDLQGEMAVQQIGQYTYDMAILGGDALDPDMGELFAADLGTAALSRAAQRRSARVLIAMDSSKIGKTSLSVVRTLQKGDLLITDSRLSVADRSKIRRRGVDVRVVREDG